MEITECDLLPDNYYHLTNPINGFLWNTYLGKGITHSISEIARQEGMEGASTIYSFANSESKKEEFWEQVRKEKFPNLPTRIKALFLFDNRDIADTFKTRWFSNEKRLMVELRIIKSSSLHKVDMRWLDRFEHQWEFAARQYWKGIMTDNPLPEIILNGQIYFPNWQEYPLDRLKDFGFGV